MEIFIIILIIVVCFLLVLVVLAQNSKGGGLASNFGGAGTSQLMGVKKTGDLLEKLTWGFAITLVVLSLTVNLIYKNSEGEEGINSINVERAQESPGAGGQLSPMAPDGGDEEAEDIEE